MSKDELAQFRDQKYINVETYRKSGVAVPTPLWFAEKDGVFYTYSLANAGKIKRIRNNPKVRMAPCDVRGKVKGTWVEAIAQIEDEAGTKRGHELLSKKYGWMKKMGDIFSKLKKRERVVITIRPS